MYDFILQTTVFASLGFIIYLLARGAARVSDFGVEIEPAKPNFFDQVLKKLPLKRIDGFINLMAERSLRKMRIVLMKVDHLLHRSIAKVKKSDDKNGDGGLPPVTQA